MLGFCEVTNDWEGTGLDYKGSADYMIGTSRVYDVDDMDSFLLVVEAKKDWPDKAVPQVICEAGCLLKKRLAAEKITPVFAILTNGTDFRFFAIDVDGVVYASGKKVLEVGEDDTYTTSSSLKEILRWITWLMSTLIIISPRASAKDLTVDFIQDRMKEVKKCFGIRSKKTK